MRCLSQLGMVLGLEEAQIGVRNGPDEDYLRKGGEVAGQERLMGFGPAEDRGR